MKYLITAAVVLLALFCPASAIPGYNYYRFVQVNASKNVTDYQVLIHVPYDVHMQADFDDVNFTDTTNSFPLPYYMENKSNGVEAWFTVRMDVTYINQSIYLWYGNAGATTSSNFYATYLPGSWKETDNSKALSDVYEPAGSTGVLGSYGVSATGSIYITTNGDNTYYLRAKTNYTDYQYSIAEYSIAWSAAGGYTWLGAGWNTYDNTAKRCLGFANPGSLGPTYNFMIGTSATDYYMPIAATSLNTYYNRTVQATTNDTKVYHNQLSPAYTMGAPVGTTGASVFVLAAWDDVNVGTYSWRDIKIRRYFLPVPVYEIGAEHSSASYLSLSYDPASPHVEQTVHLNMSWTPDYDPVGFWWDFDDGTGITYTTTNTTHIWDIGGVYNVTVVALNGSGTNYTDYDLITVTEPFIQAWILDAVSGDALANFNISVWNNTNQTNFTTTGYYVNWSYHEGPKGNVTVSGDVAYYNTTDGHYNITNTSDLNITLSAFPAVVIIRPRDASYPNLVVPADARMDNLTEIRTQSSQLDELVIDETAVCTGTCSDYYSSAEVYGQVWEYTLTATAVNTEGGDVCYAKLYISDGGYANEKLIDWVNKSAAAGTETVNRILYVSEIGWEIRETDGTLVRSGTDKPPGYPLTAYVDFGVSTDAGDETSTATAEIYGPTSELLFYVPYGVTLGTSDIITSQKTTSPFAYLDTSYYFQRLAFPIYDTSFLNYTVYLFRTADVVLQDIYIIDYDDAPVQGAYVQAYGTINASELVSSAYSDGSGKVQLPLKATQQFGILVSADGYDPESVTVYPSSGTLYITLTRSTTTWAGPYTGLSYTLDCDLPLIEGQTKNVTMTIADSLAALANFTLRVWRNNTWLHNETSTSATGGVLYYGFTIPAGAAWTYTINAEFYRTYNGTLYFHSSNITYTSLQSGTLDELRETVATMDGLSKGMISLGLLGAGFLIGPAGGAIMALLAYLIGLIGEGLLLIVIMAFGAVYAKEVFR